MTDYRQLELIIQRTKKTKKESLLLSRHGISQLPPEIGSLEHLIKMDLSDNSLTVLPDGILQLKNLTHLSLSGNKLRTIPSGISELRKLTYLRLEKNLLTELPSEVFGLKSLEELNIDNNRLSELSPLIGGLTGLLTLSASSNQLSSLPIEIKNLTSLRYLFLNDNRLRSIIKEIGVLRSLETLELVQNQLGHLAPEICQLLTLTSLDLRGNRLTELPIEIGELRMLSTLDIRDNEITSLPPQIGLLQDLTFIGTDGNPISYPPREIVSQGTSAILAYFRGGLKNSTTKQWQSKMMVVGEGGVGKTSLLRALQGHSFNTQESTTHGIDVKVLELTHPTDPSVTMHLKTWDFGGQEIYHATHQFFLTNRSLFLLVWNARMGYEQGKLYYWLDTIKARAPESPVILVATYIDERQASIPLAELRRKYPQIVAHCEVSNKYGVGIDDLRTQIGLHASRLPLMGQHWPANWLRAANAIHHWQQEYMTPNQLFGLMGECEIGNDDASVLAQYLHELGDILYFQDDQELDDIVILNPEWVTHNISRVLDSNEVIKNLGLFEYEHMQELWGDLDPALQRHFLRLMEKFDLSYRTHQNKDISLIVERLPLDPADFDAAWNKLKDAESFNEITMKFILNTTMPAGVPTWFIARSHRFTTHIHWRYGALFADGPEGQHLALIQAFPHDRYLKLSVRGPMPQNFFALLKDGLELTLQRFPGIEIQRRIPCPGHDGEACDHEFELSHLQKAMSKTPPIMDIQCHSSFENVSVQRLLFGIPVSSKYEHELIELAQREFVTIYHREQSKLESHCPNVFVLHPSGQKRWLEDDKLEMHLFCQEPGCWHPVEGGKYGIEQPLEWLKTVAPYFHDMVSVLKYARPQRGSWITGSYQIYKRTFEKTITIMEEIDKDLENLAGIKVRRDDRLLSNNLGDSRMQTAWRSLRKLLDERDPNHHWGALTKVLTPEGHFLWLCDYHREQYA